jgi:hypothetical protein
MVLPEQPHGCLPDVQCVRCGAIQLGLPVIGQQSVVPDTYSHGRAKAVLLPKSGSHAFAQGHEGNLYIILIDQIPRCGGGVANTLHRRYGIITPDAGVVLPIGKLVEHDAVFAQQPVQKIRIGLGQFPNRGDPILVQLPGGGRANVEQIAHRKSPSLIPIVLRGNDRCGIGFFHI